MNTQEALKTVYDKSRQGNYCMVGLHHSYDFDFYGHDVISCLLTLTGRNLDNPYKYEVKQSDGLRNLYIWQ